jgi:hypothetical protein
VTCPLLAKSEDNYIPNYVVFSISLLLVLLGLNISSHLCPKTSSTIVLPDKIKLAQEKKYEKINAYNFFLF